MFIEICDENNNDVAGANCMDVIWNSPKNLKIMFTSKQAFKFDDTYLI